MRLGFPGTLKMIAENHYGDGTMYINMLTTVTKNGKKKMTTL
jgi:hypothetical protein